MKRRGLITIVAVLALAGCASPQPEAEPTPTPTFQMFNVEWEDYDAGLQERIDALAQAADCDGLQEEFNTADANTASTLDRIGHTNANLMRYIDTELREAGCY